MTNNVSSISSSMQLEDNMSDRLSSVKKIVERPGPLAPPEFQASSEILPFIQENLKLLVIGAGGLGCELLKNLALLGFCNVHVIDMDTIDVSNLNRQFLFRPKDVGASKAKTAAKFINSRVPGANVIAHHAKIQDFDEEFYQQFCIILCGLDNIVARRWINGMLQSMLTYKEDGEVDETSMIRLIDGGTEGFKGNARVILPGSSACVDCTLDLYPPQVNYPLCTIAHTPRLPEHCIEYVRILLWPKEQPFGEEGDTIDGDDPNHIQWIYDKSVDRARQYNIQGVTYRLTQGVVKHIIPAVASTNAVIAAACATEAFKLATSCASLLNNYMLFNDTDGVYTTTFENEKKENCPACSQAPKTLQFKPTSTLRDVVDFLTHDESYQMTNPGITTVINGKNKTLYMQTVKSIADKTRPNLKKTLDVLGLTDGQRLLVADVTTPMTQEFSLSLHI